MLKQTPKGKVSKEKNKRETEAWGRVVRCPNRNLQQTGIFSLDSKTPEDQNMRAFFLCQSDKVRVRSHVPDFPCPQDLFGHCFVCQFKEIRPLGITVLSLWGGWRGLRGGNFFLIRKVSSCTPTRQFTRPRLFPVSGDVLIFCLWPWHLLGMPSPCQFSHIIFPLLLKYFHDYC